MIDSDMFLFVEIQILQTIIFQKIKTDSNEFTFALKCYIIIYLTSRSQNLAIHF